MKKEVVFVQGGGEGAHAEDGRLVASLRNELGAGYDVRYPTMPNESSPEYPAWRPRLADVVATSHDGVILVGHSIGATMLIRFLAEGGLKGRAGGIFLIAAAFVGDGGWTDDEFELPRRLAARLPAGTPVFLYHGSDDQTVPFAHVDLFERALPHAVVRRLERRDHQLDDDLSDVAADIRTLGQ